MKQSLFILCAVPALLSGCGHNSSAKDEVDMITRLEAAPRQTLVVFDGRKHFGMICGPSPEMKTINIDLADQTSFGGCMTPQGSRVATADFVRSHTIVKVAQPGDYDYDAVYQELVVTGRD